jgi:hypothetical protein
MPAADMHPEEPCRTCTPDGERHRQITSRITRAEEMTRMSTKPAMPDAGADLEAMDLAAVQAELAAYKPSTREAMVTVEAYMARRVRLWQRLDALTMPGAGGRPTSPSRPRCYS